MTGDEAQAGPEGARSLHSSYTANRPQDDHGDQGAPHTAERPGQESLTRCPAREGWYFFDYVTGVSTPATCGRNGCAYCVHRNARRRAAAIAYAAPEREVTLTQVGNDWATIRYRVNKVCELLRREGLTVLWDWHVEPNPKGTGHHVHGWQKGSYLPQALLSEVAEKAGCGRVTHVSRLRDVAKAGTYGLKGLAAAGYGLKGVSDPAEYLTNNGGRLSHHSRGFYLSPSGATIGVRLAEKLGVRALYGQDDEEHSWTLVRETSLASVERVRAMATARASATRSGGTGPSSTAGARRTSP